MKRRGITVQAFWTICCILTVSACDQEARLQLAECTKKTAELSDSNTQLTAQIAALTSQISNLTTENQELARTPARRLSEISDLIGRRDEVAAKAAVESLQKTYPASAEVISAAALLSALQAKLREEREVAERQERLGFKALKEEKTFEASGIKLTLTQAQIANRWTFDDYGDAYFYRDATRDNRFVLARVSITADVGNNNPRLPGFGVYTVSAKKLILLGSMDYRFDRWDDYGSYLGNEADFKNDFAHTATISFTLGAEISKGNLQKPVLILAARAPCKERSYDRFTNPPVSYRGGCEDIKQDLSLDQVRSGKYVLIKSWNFN